MAGSTMKVKIDPASMRKMQQAVSQVAMTYPGKVRGALFRRAEKLMTRIKQSEVPVDLGTLRDTGIVTMDPNPKRLAVELAFGGPSAGYAIIVHETHKTKSKFLERPLLETVNTLGADLAKEAQLG